MRACWSSVPSRVTRSRTWARAFASPTCSIRSAMCSESSRTRISSRAKSSERAAMKRATGSFEVSLQSLSNAEVTNEALLGRMLLNKTFSGDLSASARGQMLSAGTATRGSAGYVAIDRVTGTLDGRKGSFLLQHSGRMNRGVPSLSIMVVPDSGTDELAGIAGTLSINIIDGKHFYDFIYSIPGQSFLKAAV